MKLYFYTFTAVAIFYCCSGPNNSNHFEEDQIVISKEDRIWKSKRDSILKINSSAVFPPSVYYTQINFILDETSNIYFHNQNSKWNSEEPPLINLKKEDVVVLSYDDINEFVDSIYETFGASKWKLVQIASTSDSINMKSFGILNEQIDLKRRFAKTPLRLITKEELNVLTQIKK